MANLTAVPVLTPQPAQPPTLLILAHEASALKDSLAAQFFTYFLERHDADETGRGFDIAASEAYRAAHALLVERARRAG